MSERINLQNSCRYPIEAKRLKQASHNALEGHDGYRQGSLSIVISDGEALKEMNRKYRQVNAPTDVLSFPASPMPDDIGPSDHYLGDILIAYDYVAAHAKARGTRLHDTLCLLVIHGTLHLLGHEHDKKEDRERMWAEQKRALRALDIDPAIVDEYGTIPDD